MKGRGRRLVGLCLTALLVSMCASQSDDASHSLEPPRVIYVYDALGRLRAVTDPEADTAVYAYDAVGNITEIEHHPSDELSVVEVTPRDAAVGAEVVINGTGFDDASVFFGDAEAEVTEDSDVELVVTVPEGAEPGPVEVRAADDEASSDEEFVVDEHRAHRGGGRHQLRGRGIEYRYRSGVLGACDRIVRPSVGEHTGRSG